MHPFYLNGEAISFEPEYFDTVDMHYELYHNYRLLRFIFLHQQNDCRIDLIQTTDEDHYWYVIKNYKEVDFTTDMNATPWARIWKRSHENISFLDDECTKDSVEVMRQQLKNYMIDLINTLSETAIHKLKKHRPHHFKEMIKEARTNSVDPKQSEIG